jgi:nucleoside-diphosphate-sugar epimerase
VRVLLFGAGGYLGSALARHFRGAGHEIAVLARDGEKAAAFAAEGLTPVSGDLDHIAGLAGPIAQADAVVFASAIPFDREWPVFSEILALMQGSGKTFVMTSGTGVLSHETPLGEWRQETYAEDDAFTPPPWIALRVETENRVRAFSSEGVRTMVVRPPQIWGNNGSKQIPALFEGVRTSGAACYIGRGLNLYTHVHVDDLAEVYRLALERGRAGALYHAVAGEACWKSIAEAVAVVMNCPARSVSIDEAKAIWGEFIGPLFFGVSSRSRAVRTRDELGWEPTHFDLVEDVRSGSYSVRGRQVPHAL